jgi:hypothetical protein
MLIIHIIIIISHKTGGCLPFAPIKCNKIITAVFKFHKKYIAEHLPMPVWYDNTDGANDDNNVNNQHKSYVEISLTSKIR